MKICKNRYPLIILLSITVLSCKITFSESSSGAGHDGDALFVPIDSDGWTSFTPSPDSRILYISSDGDDGTAQIYSTDSFDDPFSPDAPPAAFATYTAAYSHTREGFPDWILYRRGDTFDESPGTRVRSGRGGDEPFLIGSYGDSGASPLINTGTNPAVNISNTSPSTSATTEYVALQGLRFYAHTRNPQDPDFSGYVHASAGIRISTYESQNIVRNILIEGCTVSYYSGNMIIQAAGDPGSVTDIEVRRNTILNAYSIDSHAQGLYASGINGLRIEENIFDHNGWLRPSSDNDRTEGGATFHNHNVYTDGVQNGVYRDNIFLRASSIGTKIQGNAGIDGLVVDNNLYVDGEIGIESCNNYHEYHYRVHNPLVTNNVFYELGRSNPTMRNVGWGMWIQGWDGGKVSGNLLISHQGQMFFNLGLRSRGVEISDNVGMFTSMYGIYHNSEVELLDISIHDNYFEKLNDENDRMIMSDGASIGGIGFSHNTYYSPAPLEFRIGDESYSPDQWTAEYEGDAQLEERSFPDDTRTIEAYMERLGEDATLDSFFSICRAQERYHWDLRFTAEVINEWLRDGYGIPYVENN